MSDNIAEYVTVWHFNGLHDGEKNCILFQTVFVQFTSKAFKWTHTHTHTHTLTHFDECNNWKCNHIINPISNNFMRWDKCNLSDFYWASRHYASQINTSWYNVDINVAQNECQDDIDYIYDNVTNEISINHDLLQPQFRLANWYWATIATCSILIACLFVQGRCCILLGLHVITLPWFVKTYVIWYLVYRSAHCLI